MGLRLLQDGQEAPINQFKSMDYRNSPWTRILIVTPFMSSCFRSSTST